MKKMQKNRSVATHGFPMLDSNIMKGMAILLMLFHHLFNDYPEYEGYPVNYAPFSGDALTNYAVIARICVPMFIFITGYGLTLSYRKMRTQTFSHVSPVYTSSDPLEKKEDDSHRRNIQAMFHFSYSRTIKLMAVYWFVFVASLLAQPLGRTVMDAYGTNLYLDLVYFVIDFFGLSYLFKTPTINPTWWYMTLALLFLWLLPILYELAQRFGIYLTMIVIAAMLLLCGTESELTHQIVAYLIGITCAYTEFFEKLDGLTSVRKILLCLGSLFLVVVMMKIRFYNILFGYTDAMIVFGLAILTKLFLSKIPVCNQLLAFLGKHSMHVFLIHNLLYCYYFLGFFYSFYYWWLILIVTEGVSLAVGLVMEFIEEKSGYLKWVNALGAKLELHFHH